MPEQMHVEVNCNPQILTKFQMMMKYHRRQGRHAHQVLTGCQQVVWLSQLVAASHLVSFCPSTAPKATLLKHGQLRRCSSLMLLNMTKNVHQACTNWPACCKSDQRSASQRGFSHWALRVQAGLHAPRRQGLSIAEIRKGGSMWTILHGQGHW